MAKRSSSCGWKGKSARTPLSEISGNNNVRVRASSKCRNPRKKKISPHADAEDKSLDLLLMAHSQLSNALDQIDELVVQACKLWPMNKIENQEIACFTNVLSDIHSSLQPWIPRFQQAFSCKLCQSHNQLQQPSMTETVSAENEEKEDAAISHAEDSLISPSPLVSWRGGDKIETGKQLFLLTPLPRSKALSSKNLGSCRSILEKVSNMNDGCQILSHPPSLIISGISHDPLIETLEEKSELEESPFSVGKGKSKSVIQKVKKYRFAAKVTEQSKFDVEGKENFMPVMGAETFDRCFSPPTASNHNRTDHSIYLMTPRMKMSPPKTCMLLEPIPDSFQHQRNRTSKSTPFAFEIKEFDDSSTTETSSAQATDSLASKFQELLGIQLCHRPRIRKEEIETSLDWFLSPPKTCVLMETPNEKVRDNPSEMDAKSKCPADVLQKEVYDGCQATKESYIHGPSSANFSAALYRTPLWKDVENTAQKGKQAGENTLRRELWTKFEAASTNGLRFDSCRIGHEDKRFLDRLEEVSCEDTGFKS